MPRQLFYFWKKKFSFSLTWEPMLSMGVLSMGAKASKLYSSLKSLLNPFKFFLNFLLSCPHKSSVLDFWNFEFLIFHNFFLLSLTWDPMGAKMPKHYSSLKSLLNPFILFLNFLLSCPHKSTVLDFEILSFWFFTIFFFVFINVGPYGSQNFRTLLLPQITFESFQTFSEFSS